MRPTAWTSIAALGLSVAYGAAEAARAQAPAQAPVPALVAACQRSDFEAVVDAAAASLRDLNQANKPGFQEKLRQLKTKRGWSHDQLMREGVAYVRDERISDYDQKSEELLARISSRGEASGGAKTPDCAVLIELRAEMQVLVETQQAKWAYMLEKIGRELAK